MSRSLNRESYPCKSRRRGPEDNTNRHRWSKIRMGKPEQAHSFYTTVNCNPRIQQSKTNEAMAGHFEHLLKQHQHPQRRTTAKPPKRSSPPLFFFFAGLQLLFLVADAGLTAFRKDRKRLVVASPRLLFLWRTPPLVMIELASASWTLERSIKLRILSHAKTPLGHSATWSV